MYLTRMELDMRRKKTMLAFANRRLFHGAVEAAFEGERKRRLWRIDRLGNACYLLIVSEDKPNLQFAFEQFGPYQKEPYWETKFYDILLDRIENGSRWQFRLTANPTISSSKDRKDRNGESIAAQKEKEDKNKADNDTTEKDTENKDIKNTETKSKRGIVYAHSVERFQRDWFKNRTEKNGFHVEDRDLAIVQSQWVQFTKRQEGNRVSFISVTYEGILTVMDKDAFVRVLTEGIGREKAYGMGMLTVMRV